jgi:asparagine synthase (glutamine-hydrolysing)
MVADRYRTNHFVETVKSDDFDLIDTLARLYDEPYADSSAIPPTACASWRAST